MKNWFLYVLVFVSGGSVLAVEILGTRILGPFYGVSLFLWSALITVTLAALSIGYAIGGRWADRGPMLSKICYAVGFAGLWLLLVPWLKYPVLTITEPFGLRVAVLFAALILFGIPLTLLGMVSPYAIRLKAARLAEVGRTAGDLYAISTVASVVAALLTGYFLIPNMGVQGLTAGIGIVLLVTAGAGLLLSERSPKTISLFVGALLTAGLFAVLTPSEKADPEAGLLAVEQSAYAEIRVLDLNDRRYMIIDGGTHTIVDPSTWETHFTYAAVTELTQEFFEQPGRMLLIGLGGGSIMKSFAKAGWEVDAVEIDPVVTRMAQQYFGLSPEEGRIFHEDGRQFLLNRDEQYDIIVIDAFGSSSIPFHLITQESFGVMAARLKPNGVMAMNVESIGWEDRIVRAMTATLKTQFDEVKVLPTTASPDELGNVIFMASNQVLTRDPDLPRDITNLDYGRSLEYKKDMAWDNRFTPEVGDAPVLTDDFNPVDLWSEKINLIARQNLHEFFDDGRLSW